MTFPVVEATATGPAESSATTSHVVNLPTGISSGELLVVLVGRGAPGTCSATGWTEGGGTNTKFLYRVADGTEGSTVTVTTGASFKGWWDAYRISGADTATAPEQGAEQTGSGTSVDVGDLTPSWGAADTLWIERANGSASAAIGVTGASINWTNLIAGSASGGGSKGYLGSAQKNENTATQNPLNMTLDTSATWFGAIIGVKPAPASGPQTVSPGLIDQSSVLFNPTITSKATVSPGLIDQSATLFVPTITSKSTVTPGLIDQSGTLFAPSISISGGAQTVSPGLISQTGALFDPTITSRSTITPPLIDQSGILFAPTITSKSMVVPGLIDQSATLFAPSVSISGGPQTVSPSLIDQSGILFAPTVLSSQTVSPGLISQVPFLFNPIITSKFTLTIPLISQVGTLFSPAIQQDQMVSPSLISNLAIVFTPIVVSGAFGEPVNDPQAIDLVSAGQASVFGLEEGRAVDISHQ